MGGTEVSGGTRAQKPSLGLATNFDFDPRGSSLPQAEDGSRQRTQTTAVYSPLSDHIQAEGFANPLN